MDNYYHVKFANVSGFFVFANTAIEAIKEARAIITAPTDGLLKLHLGAAIVRRAAYGEWDCGTAHITIDGNHHH